MNAPFAAVADRSLGVRAALVLLRGYKVCISPYYRGSCRFLPSCADYAAEAIDRHGVIAGIWLAARRLSRCHPFCTAGHDPVPARSVSEKREHAPSRPASPAETPMIRSMAARAARLLGARSPLLGRAPRR